MTEHLVGIMCRSMMTSTVIYDGPVEEFTLMPWRQYVSDFKLALMHAIVFFGVRNYSQGQDILTCTLRMQSATRTGTGKSLLIYFRIVLGMLTSLNISTARFHKRLNHLRPRARIVDSDGHIESDVQTLRERLNDWTSCPADNPPDSPPDKGRH